MSNPEIVPTPILPQPMTFSIQAIPDSVRQLISGGISGGIARTITSPFERTIILQQTKNPRYLNQSVGKILLDMGRNEGFKGYFKGNGTNVMRIVPFTSIELFSFEIYKGKLFRLFGDNADTKKKVYFAAGALAGMTAATLVYPLDLVRTLFAFQTARTTSQTILSFGTQIVKEHGPRGLYKGLGATLIGITPFVSLKLTFFQLLKNLYQSYNVKNQDLASLISGGIAGCAAVSVTYPTDLIRRRLQIGVLQNSGDKMSYLGLLKKIYMEEGIRGFYKGLPATYMKLIPSTAITFMLNEKLKRALKV